MLHILVLILMNTDQCHLFVHRSAVQCLNGIKQQLQWYPSINYVSWHLYYMCSSRNTTNTSHLMLKKTSSRLARIQPSWNVLREALFASYLANQSRQSIHNPTNSLGLRDEDGTMFLSIKSHVFRATSSPWPKDLCSAFQVPLPKVNSILAKWTLSSWGVNASETWVDQMFKTARWQIFQSKSMYTSFHPDAAWHTAAHAAQSHHATCSCSSNTSQQAASPTLWTLVTTFDQGSFTVQ